MKKPEGMAEGLGLLGNRPLDLVVLSVSHLVFFEKFKDYKTN
jgi:hypothetical protein